MDGDAGGWLWLLIDVGFVAILAAALMYAILMWRSRRRDATIERARDDATRELYQRRDGE
jgi:hypothetical protein